MIDVIVPVYRGAAETRRCLESVLGAAQSAPHEVVVVDDASPDAEVARYVRELAQAKRVTLLANEGNLGFVQSVNRGMRLHADRDVVLLNSDTEVANDWLDRLAAAAHRERDVATVTPFSNNATICSYPFEGWAGGVPGTLGLAALDRLFATVLTGHSVDLPTAVGFCMYIRRDALDALGLFDAERFGRGYGEENDFCMRAGKAGWRNVLAADVFVYHEGSVSFSKERLQLTLAAGKALVEVHPDYPQKVHEFLVTEPTAALRAAMDVARLECGLEEGRRVLAERAEERARIMAGLWGLDRLAADRDSTIGQLNRGLMHAMELVSDRDRIIAEHDSVVREKEELIASLRAGLAHAEKLAFERADELQRIHSSILWRGMSFLRRRALLLAAKARRPS